MLRQLSIVTQTSQSAQQIETLPGTLRAIRIYSFCRQHISGHIHMIYDAMHQHTLKLTRSL